ASADTTGAAELTVTATNSENRSTQRKFEVRVMADEQNDRAFLRLINDPSTTVNTPVTINLPAVDLEGDTLTYVARNLNFGTLINNATVDVDQDKGQVTVTPDTGFQGTIEFFVGVRDQTRRTDSDRDGRITDADNLDAQANFDTERITLTVSSSSEFTWRNPTNPLDVNNDTAVAPLDALLVLNELSIRQVSDPVTGQLPALTAPPPSFLDVTGDNIVAPLDALLVINALPNTSRPALSGTASQDGAANDAMPSSLTTSPEHKSERQKRLTRSGAIDAIWARA
ncbi:MAG TPA: dockerin type I domain-containing protein, partial [Pirellulaceae bacterium]